MSHLYHGYLSHNQRVTGKQIMAFISSFPRQSSLFLFDPADLHQATTRVILDRLPRGSRLMLLGWGWKSARSRPHGDFTMDGWVVGPVGIEKDVELTHGIMVSLEESSANDGFSMAFLNNLRRIV